jgi:hypothetical protein
VNDKCKARIQRNALKHEEEGERMNQEASAGRAESSNAIGMKGTTKTREWGIQEEFKRRAQRAESRDQQLRREGRGAGKERCREWVVRREQMRR